MRLTAHQKPVKMEQAHAAACIFAGAQRKIRVPWRTEPILRGACPEKSEGLGMTGSRFAGWGKVPLSY
jgi:hypothetical protein